jgi:hypothetical protein
MMFWNLVLLSVPNDRSHRGVSRKTIIHFLESEYFFELWAIVFNREISPADRPNHFKKNTNFLFYRPSTPQFDQPVELQLQVGLQVIGKVSSRVEIWFLSSKRGK